MGDNFLHPPLVGPRFPIGQLVIMPGVSRRIGEEEGFAEFVIRSLKRHAEGDWGEGDRQANEEALRGGSRLVSTYEREGMPRLSIITDGGRSAMVILFAPAHVARRGRRR